MAIVTIVVRVVIVVIVVLVMMMMILMMIVMMMMMMTRTIVMMVMTIAISVRNIRASEFEQPLHRCPYCCYIYRYHLSGWYDCDSDMSLYL
jgi:hypothetical protein